MRAARILVVDDEESLRRVLQVQLENRGYETSLAKNGQEALAILAESPHDLVLTDLRMPGLSGLELLKRIRENHQGTEVILLTAFGTIENAVEAMQSGAYHYVTKPVRFDELSIVIERALERCRMIEQIATLRESLTEKYGFENIIGHSSSLRAAIGIASRAARSSSVVLIEGETGTGKELLARAVHANSPRNEEPFVAVNCGAIPRDLLESELFGYKKGAFTGATNSKAGRIEGAEGGTLFLDEIGELPLQLQVKLLRLIQEGEIQKLGAVEPVKVNVRIVAATNRNLLRMVEDGDFREDLYYRLAVIPVTLPPLRERAEDIPELVEYFWKLAIKKHGRPELQLPERLLPYFSRYHWPGNIRELANLIERITILSPEPVVTLEDLPEILRQERGVLDAIQLELPATPISLEAVERELIVRALDRFNWNQTKAAGYLNLTRKTLIYRMERYNLRREQPEKNNGG
ncbi:MAG TPA: sigma-54 dependent transcriptional regulator [Bryobacteraceae bacterium]|nr:sigma-54 dependent transcriptional regulator [Bryobacteraceae bacterium]